MIIQFGPSVTKMVLEAFAALSLASSIVQFVDFGSKLVVQSTKIYKSNSGTSEEILDLKSLSRDLQDLTVGLQVRFIATSRADQGIAQLAKLCNNEAKALSSVLQRLSGNPDCGKWKTFLQALATLWEKDRIEALRKSLGLIQTQLVLHLVMLTR